MYDRTGNLLIVAILIGMILGVIVAAISVDFALHLKFLGVLFLNALKMVVIPLLFCSMIVGITNLGDVRKLGRTGGKTLLYFLATSSISVVIGLILVNVFQPGAGFSLGTASSPEVLSYSFFDWLTAQIPSNIVSAAAETKVLPIIVFALFFGGVLTTIGSKGRPVIAFFEGLNEAIMKIVHIIMWFAPIGILGLVAGQLASEGGVGAFASVLEALGKYSLVVILGLLIHGVVVLPLFLKFLGGKNPIEYLIGMSQALMTAFATASSSATLPVTMDCAEEKNDIDKRSTSFVLPLGATVNMDGTALYEAVAAMFIAQAYGIELSILAQITIFGTAVLASVGAAGIPQAGLVTMVLVLQAVGLPLDGIGLILAIDWFLDRCRTTVNVWGDSIGAAVIATTAEIGLVDRRPRRPARTDRPARSRQTSRRDDYRSKKKGRETAKSAHDKHVPRGKKSEKPTGKISRRPTSQTERKKGGRSDGKTVKKVQNDDGFRMSEREEIYKPSNVSKPEKPPEKKVTRRSGKKAESKSAPAVETIGGQKTEKPAKAKSTYGRKPSRNRPAKSSPDDSGKVKIAAKPEKQEAKTEIPDFTIPKFPANTLEELTAREKDTPISVDTPEVETHLDREDYPKPELSPAVNLRDELSPASVEKENTMAKKDSDDFSRLDKIISGDVDDSKTTESIDLQPIVEKTQSETPDVSSVSVEKVDDKTLETPTATSSDPEPVIEEKVPSITEPVVEEKMPSIPEPVIEEQVPSTPETVIEAENTLASEPVSDKVDSPVNKVDKEPEVIAAAPAETPDSEEPDKAEEPAQWGRSKRRKINR
ncbi:MAG: cation:dicarboxylase symporter family transporter [FCB group bacterium]|nr:cation:dicarboxylase symporter family transporter [FCB group bacterium]